MAEQVEKIASESPVIVTFYKKKGLRFQCRRCSGCCRHNPGFVFLSEKDIRDLVEITELSIGNFFRLYLRIVNIGAFYRVSLREKANYDCIFWEAGGCRVYPKRPLQCRSFPFWNSLLASEAIWREQTKSCPGIGAGLIHDFAEIESWRTERIAERLKGV